MKIETAKWTNDSTGIGGELDYDDEDDHSSYNINTYDDNDDEIMMMMVTVDYPRLPPHQPR